VPPLAERRVHLQRLKTREHMPHPPRGAVKTSDHDQTSTSSRRFRHAPKTTRAQNKRDPPLLPFRVRTSSDVARTGPVRRAVHTFAARGPACWHVHVCGGLPFHGRLACCAGACHKSQATSHKLQVTSDASSAGASHRPRDTCDLRAVSASRLCEPSGCLCCASALSGG